MAVMLSAALSMQAQRTISGTIVDKETSDPAMQASVQLLKTDSTRVASTVSNTSGKFSLTAPQYGSFLLKVTYVGYKTLIKPVTVSGQPVQMGTLSLEEDATLLKNVMVVKNVAKVQSKGDTLIYNADAFKVPEGSVVEELVKRLPGAELDESGNIKINGKQVSKIKVDNKEFGDAQTALKNLPANIVERIRAYDEKSDLARITGIDDGNEQTVLDFGLRAGMNRGTMANVDLGVGTKDRYTSRIFGMYMKDDYRVMAMGNAANANEGMGGGGRRFGGGGGMGGGGLNAQKTGMVNLNYEKTDRIIAQASVNVNHRDGDTWSRRSSENFVGTTSSFQNSINQSYSRSHNWSAQGRIEWTPDTLWNISFRPQWSYGTNDSRSWNTSATFNDDPYDKINYQLDAAVMAEIVKNGGDLSDIIVNGTSNRSLSYGENKRLGGTLMVNRLLSGTGRNLTLQLTGNYSNNENQQMSSNQTKLFQSTATFNGVSGLSEYQTNRYNLTPTKSWDYSVRATYSEPVAYATFLQFSYTFQYRNNENDRSTFDYSNPLLNKEITDPHFNFNDISNGYRKWNNYFSNVPTNDGSLYHPVSNDPYYTKDQSRYSAYKNYIHTGELMLRFIRNTYDFNVGVQVIPQSSEYTQRYLGVDTVVNRTVTNWSPTANFRWRFSQQGNLRFEYRGSTSQPSIEQLLVINDDTDPLNKTTGNADLKPSFTQSFNLRYNDYFMARQQMINANANFSTTSNSIANKVSYDPTTGGRTSRPENSNGNWNAGANIMWNSAIDSLGLFSYSISLNDNYNHRVSYLDQNRQAVKNATNSNNIGSRLGLTYRNDWLEVALDGQVNYQHSRNELQPSANLDTWQFTYGGQFLVRLPWDFEVSMNLHERSRRGYNDASMNTNELLWNGQISKPFLKSKSLIVALNFYDLLGQQSNYERWVNATGRSDTRYNSINSYAMLHIRYRLNMFGGKVDTEGRYDKKWGNRDQRR